MVHRTGGAVVLLVAVVAIGGLVLTQSQGSTGLVPAGQPVSQYTLEKNCQTFNPEYLNCASPRGGCVDPYPLVKQTSVEVEGIPTCCCIPIWSTHKKRFGGSPYR